MKELKTSEIKVKVREDNGTYVCEISNGVDRRNQIALVEYLNNVIPHNETLAAIKDLKFDGILNLTHQYVVFANCALTPEQVTICRRLLQLSVGINNVYM